MPQKSSMKLNLAGWGLLFSLRYLLHSMAVHSSEHYILRSGSTVTQFNPFRQVRVLSYYGILFLHGILFHQIQPKLLIITKQAEHGEIFLGSLFFY